MNAEEYQRRERVYRDISALREKLNELVDLGSSSEIRIDLQWGIWFAKNDGTPSVGISIGLGGSKPVHIEPSKETTDLAEQLKIKIQEAIAAYQVKLKTELKNLLAQAIAEVK